MMKKDKYLDNPNKDAILLSKEFSRLMTRHEKEGKKLVDMYKTIQKICIHNETEEIHNFYEGSYLNKSQHEYVTKCKICGKIISTRSEMGSFV